MLVVKGILSFPTLFTPKAAKGATEPKFSCSVLIAPNDPQIQVLEAAVNEAKANAFPNGYTGTDECFAPYDVKYRGKDYYDPKFSGWYVFSATAKAEDKPAVVDQNHQPIINPADAYPGAVAYVNAAISGYVKGKGGIGGWLNGVMITAEEPPMGRLDSKPTVEQMFASVSSPTATVAGPGAPTPVMAAPAAPMPQAAAAPPPQPSVPQYVMTEKAAGFTREQYHAQGWTDEQLMSEGMMQLPGGVVPSFAG